MTFVKAKAFIVDSKGASWWDGLLDTDDGMFAYYTFKDNIHHARVARRDDYIRVEILEEA
jgi:hypothetical protein